MFNDFSCIIRTVTVRQRLNQLSVSLRRKTTSAFDTPKVFWKSTSGLTNDMRKYSVTERIQSLKYDHLTTPNSVNQFKSSFKVNYQVLSGDFSFL